MVYRTAAVAPVRSPSKLLTRRASAHEREPRPREGPPSPSRAVPPSSPASCLSPSGADIAVTVIRHREASQPQQHRPDASIALGTPWITAHRAWRSWGAERSRCCRRGHAASVGADERRSLRIVGLSPARLAAARPSQRVGTVRMADPWHTFSASIGARRGGFAARLSRCEHRSTATAPISFCRFLTSPKGRASGWRTWTTTTPAPVSPRVGSAR